MDYFIGILIFGAIIAACVAVVYTKHVEWQRRKAIGFPDKAPRMDDCIEASRQMLIFLDDRLYDTGAGAFADCKCGMEGSYLSLLRSHDIPDLIRYAHLAGCHITIEKVANHDIENPKNTKEKLEEFHTDLKIARHILVCKKLGIPESTPMSKTQGL